MPVFPGVAAIAYTELQRDPGIFHFPDEFQVAIKQEIIIAAIDEPSH